MKLTGIFPGNLLLADGFELAAEAAAGTVERDAEGVPVAWRLLRCGDNALCKNGQSGVLSLDRSDMQSIIDHHRLKGVKIPIDSAHYLYDFAEAKGLDEGDVLKLIPDARGAMGFGSLALRGNDLWLESVDWPPVAREILKGGMYKYFSPSIRGLAKGPLRVTSVALENEPCLNNLDSLAARGEDEELLQLPNNEVTMKKLETALAQLLRRDSIALGGEEDSDNIAEEVTKKATFFDDLRTMLSLPDATDDALAGAIKALVEKAGGADALAQELDALKMSAEDEKKKSLIASGVASGKLTSQQAAGWAKGLDSIALAAYLKDAPRVVPLEKLPSGTAQAPLETGDSAALTAEDEKAIRRFGFDRETYLKAKNGGVK